MKYFLFFIILLTSCSERKKKADRIFHNGIIYTADSIFSIASAMAIGNGVVLKTGTDEELLNEFESLEVHDLKRRCIYPGFHDAHAHFFGLAESFRIISLKNTRSWKEILDTLIKYSKNSKDWILGRGWDQNDWKNPSYPGLRALDSLFPDRPVFLKRIDGHAAIANSEALRRAKISSTTQIPGGIISLKKGRPDGLLIDRAMEPVENIIPSPTDEEWAVLLQKAAQKCLSYGLTSITECGIAPRQARMLFRLQQNGLISLNFSVMLSDRWEYVQWLKDSAWNTDHFKIIGIKAYADGALGSRGACLLQPYSDASNYYGMMITTVQHLDSLAKELFHSGLQLCTHAIGDSAVRTLLRIYSRYLPPGNTLRWRIEHCQVVHPSDLVYFKKYNILPSVQPTHALSDAPWAIQRLGTPRINTAYTYRTLLEQSGEMPLGTDFPVEDVNPLGTFVTARFRKNLEGWPNRGYHVEESLNFQQTLYGMTLWPAIAGKLKKHGSLSAGNYADFIISAVDLGSLDTMAIQNLSDFKPEVYIRGRKINQ